MSAEGYGGGHTSRVCPAFGTDEVLIGCPCNEIGLDDDGLVTVDLAAMPKLYTKAAVERLTSDTLRLRDALTRLTAALWAEFGTDLTEGDNDSLDRAYNHACDVLGEPHDKSHSAQDRGAS